MWSNYLLFYDLQESLRGLNDYSVAQQTVTGTASVLAEGKEGE